MSLSRIFVTLIIPFVWSFCLVPVLTSFTPANDSCLNTVYRNSVQDMCDRRDYFHCIPDEAYRDGIYCAEWKWIPPDYCACYKERLGGMFSCPCDSSYGLCPSVAYQSNQVLNYPACYRNKSVTTSPVTSVVMTTEKSVTENAEVDIHNKTQQNIMKTYDNRIKKIMQELFYDHIVFYLVIIVLVVLLFYTNMECIVRSCYLWLQTMKKIKRDSTRVQRLTDDEIELDDVERNFLPERGRQENSREQAI